MRFLCVGSAGLLLLTAAGCGAPPTESQIVEGPIRLPVASVSVEPDTATLYPGRIVQLTATLRDAENNVLTDRPVSWASSATYHATVDENGLVTGVDGWAGGAPVTITASSEGKKGTATITVFPFRITMGAQARDTTIPGTRFTPSGCAVTVRFMPNDVQRRYKYEVVRKEPDKVEVVGSGIRADTVSVTFLGVNFDGSNIGDFVMRADTSVAIQWEPWDGQWWQVFGSGCSVQRQN